MTEKARCTGRWLSRGKEVGVDLRQIRDPLRRAPRRAHKSEVTDATLPGKVSKLQITRTVPQTDTGRQGENPKALERTRVKELGNIAP